MNTDIKLMLELHLKRLRGEKGGVFADLTDANLTGYDLTDANLRVANLTRANLADAKLTDANLTDTKLTGANLTGAKLTGADLTGAKLTGADLRDANLTRANLMFTELTGADLTGADLDFSCWPLWCGALKVKIDRRIFCQLAYHLCRVNVNDEECVEAQKALIHLANQFHRVKSDELLAISEEDLS